MIHVGELRTATSFVVIVDKSRDGLNAKLAVLRDIMDVPLDYSVRGVVDSNDLGYAFDSVGFNDWGRASQPRTRLVHLDGDPNNNSMYNLRRERY